jgi:hypothetical protein
MNIKNALIKLFPMYLKNFIIKPKTYGQVMQAPKIPRVPGPDGPIMRARGQQIPTFVIGQPSH